MRLNILAFAIGVLGLQMQPELPAWAAWAVGGLLLVIPGWRWHNRTVRLLTIAGCCALGFSMAAWRAEIRLLDQLEAGGEGRDVEVIGVVASLPQDFSHGTRFEFDVKNRSTAAFPVPQKIMLSWYQGRRDNEPSEYVPKGITEPEWNGYASES